MIRRISYYFLRARILIRQKGALALLRELWAFACRHWFLTQFAWHWFEYHVVAPRRSAVATIRRVARGDVSLSAAPGQHVLLYASFDLHDRIGDHVKAQLAAYHEAGFRTVFVTTSAMFDDVAEAAVRPYCVASIHRSNIGIDFGSWRTGYDWLLRTPEGPAMLEHAESVLLANDSCYGPFRPMLPFLERMRAAPTVVYGMTLSLEIRPYLQSYFLHFGRAIVARGLFREYMTVLVRLLGTKVAVARFLEVGGSAFLDERGVALQALVHAGEEPARSVLARHDLLDPVRDPAGREFVDRGLTPLHKRSNDLFRSA